MSSFMDDLLWNMKYAIYNFDFICNLYFMNYGQEKYIIRPYVSSTIDIEP